MLCGRCKKPLYCDYCDLEEHDDQAHRNHKYNPADCQCCKDDPIYVGKDAMWHIKSVFEIICILIMIICIFVFIGSWVALIWSKSVANTMLGSSICFGLLNFVVIISCDKDWRRDYEDHSMIRNIREEKV